MSRKSRRKLLVRMKILTICGATAFLIGSVLSCYSEEKNQIEKRAVRMRTAETSDLPYLPAATEVQNELETNTNVSQVTRSMDWDAEDAYLLAKIAIAEAEGEGIEGKALVMMVVLNRVWSEEFPDSIEDVIFQENQFSPVSNGRYDRVEPDQECYEALEMIQVEKWDESDGALYFESAGESSWHRDNLQFLFRHGNHYFYK